MGISSHVSNCQQDKCSSKMENLESKAKHDEGESRSAQFQQFVESMKVLSLIYSKN